jgi:hypothetical protein
MDPNRPSPAAAASCLAVRILGSSQSRPSLRKCVRDFYSLVRQPATQSRKENPATWLSTGLSTRRPGSCTEVIKFSTVLAPGCGHRRALGQRGLRDGCALGCCRATATGHEGLDLDTDPAV